MYSDICEIDTYLSIAQAYEFINLESILKYSNRYYDRQFSCG